MNQLAYTLTLRLLGAMMAVFLGFVATQAQTTSSIGEGRDQPADGISALQFKPVRMTTEDTARGIARVAKGHWSLIPSHRLSSNVSPQATGNTFYGAGAGLSNTYGSYNAFFGVLAGANSNSDSNSFFGASAGYYNTSQSNSFFGAFAGYNNTSGNGNSFFGSYAGESNLNGFYNSFYGHQTGRYNTTGEYNVFLGTYAGKTNTSGSNNTFSGLAAGYFNDVGRGNSFYGGQAGYHNTSGYSNTAIGTQADVSVGNLSYATAIGSGTIVSSSNTIVLGRSAGEDAVYTPGSLTVGGLIYLGQLSSGSATHLCSYYNYFTNAKTLSICSSSLRYKDRISGFQGGMELVQRLRPVTFKWKNNNQPDVGLIAEEVAEIEPLLVTRNERGEIEGVKYDQLTVVLINALKQQSEILNRQSERLGRQQQEIDSLKKLVCVDHPSVDICRVR